MRAFIFFCLVVILLGVCITGFTQSLELTTTKLKLKQSLNAQLELALKLNECKATVYEPCVIEVQCIEDLETVRWIEHQRKQDMIPKVYPSGKKNGVTP